MLQYLDGRVVTLLLVVRYCESVSTTPVHKGTIEMHFNLGQALRNLLIEKKEMAEI